MSSTRLFQYAAFALLALAAPTLADPVPTGQAPARVAVFSEPGFPAVNASALVSPAQVAADLQRAGVAADLLSAAQLADPAFNAGTYTAVVLAYGNAYPQAAFANLKRFHQSGGGFVLSGIPFTHAIKKNIKGEWEDVGNDSDAALFGPKGIGVGGFSNGPQGPAEIAPGDPLGLASLNLDWGDGHDTQALDPSTLPPSTRAVPIFTAAGGKLISALVVHGDSAYPGAVDVWTNNSLRNDDALVAYAATQLLERGTVAVLARQGRLSPSARGMALSVLLAAASTTWARQQVRVSISQRQSALVSASGVPVTHSMINAAPRITAGRAHQLVLVVQPQQRQIKPRKTLRNLLLPCSWSCLPYL